MLGAVVCWRQAESFRPGTDPRPRGDLPLGPRGHLSSPLFSARIPDSWSHQLAIREPAKGPSYPTKMLPGHLCLLNAANHTANCCPSRHLGSTLSYISYLFLLTCLDAMSLRGGSRPNRPTTWRALSMKLSPWYLVALAPITLLAAGGAFSAQIAVLGVTLGIFFGTLSLGRSAPSDATTTNSGH